MALHEFTQNKMNDQELLCALVLAVVTANTSAHNCKQNKLVRSVEQTNVCNGPQKSNLPVLSNFSHTCKPKIC